MYRFMSIVIMAMLLSSLSFAGDQDSKSDEQKKKPSKEQLDRLQQAAREEADKATGEEPGETTFKSGGLSLQALNPEFSVTGDFLNIYRDNSLEEEVADFTFRGLGLHLESYLDPYSRFKAAVPVSLEGAELGEAYFSRYGFLAGVNLSLGKFRQQFGVVNRWHKHALDWADFPLPLRMIFGPGGLNQTGFSLDRNLSIGSISQSIELQITEGANPNLFAGNRHKRPSFLGRYTLYYDVTASTYIELGATGLIGWNDSWDVAGGFIEDDSRDVEVYGADLTVLWEPTGSMRYRNLEWRSEFYYLNKNIFAPDSSGGDVLNPWGLYTSLQAKASRTFEIGARFDYYRPDVKSYAETSIGSLARLAVTDDGAYRWLVTPYITWWQSPFVKFRLEYDHEDGDGMGVREDRVIFQCVFAAGPHKHERY